MKNFAFSFRKKETVIVSLLLVVLAVLLILLGFSYERIYNLQGNQGNLQENEVGESNTTTEKEKEEEKEEESIGQGNSSSSNQEQGTIDTPAEKKSEEEVIQYFSLQSNTLDSYQELEDKESIKDKVKSTFITVVDFLFYEKEIKGYTFKELSNKAKLEVVKLALTIDHKIDDYFPDYKDTIKQGYENIKERAISLYLEVTSSICEKEPAACQAAKEDFNTMKKSFGYTFDLIKNAAKNVVGKLSDWYLDFSGKTE